jgi:hypothetical protein
MVAVFRGHVADELVLFLCDKANDPVDIERMMTCEILGTIVHAVSERKELHQQVGEGLRDEHLGKVVLSIAPFPHERDCGEMFFNADRFLEGMSVKACETSRADPAGILLDRLGVKQIAERPDHEVDLDLARGLHGLAELEVLIPRDGLELQGVERVSNHPHAGVTHDDFGPKNEVDVLRGSIVRHHVRGKERTSTLSLEVVLPEEQTVTAAKHEWNARPQDGVKVE